MGRIDKTTNVENFSEIIVQGYAEVDLEQSETESVVVEADERMIPKLKVSVRDGCLFLGFGFRWWEWITCWLLIRDKGIHYCISLRDFRGVSVSGSGKVSAKQLRGDECQLRISGSGRVQVAGLECDSTAVQISGSGIVRMGELHCQSAATHISGSGDASLSGRAERHEIRITGSGKLDAADFETGETDVRISGSGKVKLNVLKTLNVRISGSGAVDYRGKAQVSQRVSGGGRVRAMP